MAEGKVFIPEVVEPDEKLPADLRALRQFARLMDEAFSVPGTSFRFGVDSLVGLIPGIGDIIGGILSTWIIAGAMRHRVPARVIARMVFNVAADLALGAVPIAGDVFDFLFEENMMNMRLLEKHRNRGVPPRTFGEIALVLFLISLFLVFISAAMLTLLIVIVMKLLSSHPWL